MQTAAFDTPLSPPAPDWLSHTETDLSLAWQPSPVPRAVSTSATSSALAIDEDLLSASKRHTCPALSLSLASPLSHSTTSPSLSAQPLPLAVDSNVSALPFTSAAADSAKRANALPPAVMAERHRRTDTRRRVKEIAAVKRLEQLCTGGQGEIVTGAALTTQRRKRKRTSSRQYKLSTLQASAAHIERLERLLGEAQQANRVSESRVRLLSEEVGSLLERERRGLQWQDASRALRSAGLLCDRFATNLFCCRSGRLLDASSSFFTMTGFTPGGILSRVLTPLFEQSRDPHNEFAYPLVRARRGGACDGGASCGASESTEWEPLRPVQQFPHTLRLLNEFFNGQRTTFRASFRGRFADGYSYELLQKSFWIVDSEWAVNADGSRWRRPLTFATASALDEYLRVDEEL